MARLTIEQAVDIIIRDGLLRPNPSQGDGIQDCIGIVAEVKRNSSEPNKIQYLRNEVRRMLCNLQVEDSEANITKVIRLLRGRLLPDRTAYVFDEIPPAN